MFTKLLSSAIEMMIDLSKKQEPEEDVRSFEDLLTIDNVRAVMEKKGYRFFESGIYNLNIIGVRRSTVEINKFDDYLLLIYKTSPSNWVFKTYPITTDPGTYWLLNPTNPKGTAILIPGQYRSTWKIAKHQGKYEALCQRKPVKVWRDDNRDRVLDFYSSPEDEGYFGINIHRSNPYTESSQVDKWSAGCQVFKNDSDFKNFMQTMNEAAKRLGNSFSYTLIDSTDVED